MINIECEQLLKLQELAYARRSHGLKSNAEVVRSVVEQREEKAEEEALANTFAL